MTGEAAPLESPGEAGGFSARAGSSSPGWPLALRPALAATLLSVCLLYLSFPHPGLRALAWVALAPFFLAVRSQGPIRGALLGGILGWGFQATLLSWALVFGPGALVGLVTFKSLLPALMGATLGSYRSRGAAGWCLGAGMAWVSMEYLQTLGPLGMTWGMLGQSQARVPALIQVGAWVGPWGTSLTLALVNASLAEWAGRSWLVGRRPGWALGARAAGPALALGAAAAGITAGLGAWALARPVPAAGPPLTWGVVQVSMPQDLKFDPRFQAEVMGHLEALSEQAAEAGARVVVWPETSVPYRQFLDLPGLVARVEELARRLGTSLVVGSIERAAGRSTYNSASLFSPAAGFMGRYDKSRLVPFGEFIPWKEYLPPLPALDQVMDYVPGEGLKLFEAEGRRFAVLICYESMVTGLALEQVRRGAQFLVIPTNDGWFGRSSAAAHHFDMAILRAVETRRPTIQAGNTGISGFITPMGEVLRESELDQRVSLVGTLAPVEVLSLYTRIGDLLAWLCLAGWAASLLESAVRQGRAGRGG